MRDSFFLAVLFTICFSALTDVSAQQNDDIINEVFIFKNFGNISEEDLNKQPSHSYPYEFLSKKSSIYIEETDRGIVAIIDHLIRIKVFSDEPIEIAQASLVGIPFYFADGIERVTNIEGLTHHTDGTVTSLDSDEIRTADLNSRYKILEFEMPEAEQGDVIEYKYTLERRYIEELPDFYLTHRVPTINAELYFKNADFVRYDAVPQNIDFEIEYEEHRVDTSSVPYIFTYSRPNPVYIETWKAKNMDAVDASSYISSVDDIRAKIQFQISEFGLPRQPLENSWEFVTAQILRNDNPYETIEQAAEFLEMGKEIAALYDSQVEIQDSIFAKINSDVQFNEQTSIFAERGISHVLDDVPSTQAEINLALLAMLRGAGIEARPMYLSGRNFGRINKSFPSLFQLNSIMIVSEIDNETYFMDASYSHSLPNLIPVKLYNEQGMVLSDSTYTWMDITPDKSMFKLNLDITGSLTEEGVLTGSIEAETFGYPSRQVRQKQASGISSQQIVKETLFEIYQNIEFKETEIYTDPDNRDRVMLRTDFTIPDYAVTYSEGIEFRPMIVGYLFENPFESTERRVPITLDAPEFLSINYKIELPGGYETDITGETRSTSLVGASLFEEYLTEGSSLEYSFDIEITRKQFPADVYSQLRQIYLRWVQLSNNTWFIELP